MPRPASTDWPAPNTPVPGLLVLAGRAVRGDQDGSTTRRTLMDRACAAANATLGLLAEEYDVEGRRQAGNMPQAFSHLALVRAADALAAARF
ncbi:MAG: glycoside hydrolase family 15 protein [Micropruina glycogenica]